MEELISIVVPAYNVEKYIGKCLDSVLAQTHHNLEIILIDDGSTDGTGEICDAYGKKDSRIVVVHQENQGALAARNAGIEKARGEYIGFVDGDDWISGNMYQELYRLLKMHDAEVAVCKKYIYSDATGGCFAESDVIEAGYYADCKSASLSDNLFDQIGAQPGIPLNLCEKLFARKLILDNYRHVNPKLHYFEDLALGFLCMLQADGIVISNQPFYYYRQRSGSACHSADSGYLEQLTAFYWSVRQQAGDRSDRLRQRLEMFVADRAIYGLNYMMGLELREKIPYYVPPLQIIQPDEKIVLYGAGEVGKSFYRFFELARPGQIVLWVDRQYEKLQKEGLRVQDVERLRDVAYDRIMIAVKFRDNAEGIISALLQMGILPEKIVWRQPETLIGG